MKLRAKDLDVVRTPATLAARIDSLRRKGCHIIGPSMRTGRLAERHGMAFCELRVNPDPAGGEVYTDPTLMQPGEYAFSRTTLQLLSLALSLSWLPTCRPTHDPALKLVWGYRADAAIVGFDGMSLMFNGSAEVDFRDGSPQMGGWSPRKWSLLMGKNDAALKRGARREGLAWTVNGWDDAKVRRMRPFGLRLAETKAKSAAIRSLGLQASYTADDLERPFVACRVIYLPDMKDAAIRMDVHRAAMRASSLLYGQEVPA